MSVLASPSEGFQFAKPWLCLVGLVESLEQFGLLEELRDNSLRASLYIPPEILVQVPSATQGPHELGNGALVDATIDGELGRWTTANLDAELDESDDLVTEMGLPEPTSVFLPGHRHLCADGPYRRHLQLRYPIAVSEAPAGCSILGLRAALTPIILGHTNIDDLAPLLTADPPGGGAYALIFSGEPTLKKLRTAVFGLLRQRLEAWNIGPLRDLLIPEQASAS